MKSAHPSLPQVPQPRTIASGADDRKPLDGRFDETSAQRSTLETRFSEANHDRKPLVTRFGDAVDVRNRGALRMSRFAGSQMHTTELAPAVVRLWTDEQCHELSAHEARALAEQLLAAAAFADKQNGH